MATTITTPQGLQDMGLALSEDYVLGGNLDMSGFSWTPVGSSAAPFTGTLNGNGYTINNLAFTVDASRGADGWGIFGTFEGASITNLNLDSCTITLSVTTTTQVREVGVLAGLCIGSIGATATISNVTATNISITSTTTGSGTLRDIGGLVGYATICRFDTCSVAVTFVIDRSQSPGGDVASFGGVVGFQNYGQIQSCTASVAYTLSGYSNESDHIDYVGGIVGQFNSYTLASGYAEEYIDDCTSTVTFTVDNMNFYGAAGLIGYFSTAAGSIMSVSGNIVSLTMTATNCQNDSCIGGFISDTYTLSTTTSLLIADNAITTTIDFSGVSSTYDAGGMFSNFYGLGNITIRDCTVSVSMIFSVTGSVYEVGGLAGEMTLLYTNQLSNCNVTGNITITCSSGESYDIGGLFGNSDLDRTTTVSKCYYDGNISVSCGSALRDVGGLVGVCYSGNIQDCYAAGNLTASNATAQLSGIGGAFGTIYGPDSSEALTNLYAAMNVSVTGESVNAIGGLAGEIDTGRVLTNVYCVGVVSLSGTVDGGVGGFVGVFDDSLAGTFEPKWTNCAWNSSAYALGVGCSTYLYHWFAGRSYGIGELSVYKDKVYVSLAASNKSNTPDSSPVVWAVTSAGAYGVVSISGYGTDESNVVLLQNSTGHAVYAATNTASRWDFYMTGDTSTADIVWYTRSNDYPIFTGTFPNLNTSWGGMEGCGYIYAEVPCNTTTYTDEVAC